jgi:hypothetical protein
VASGVPYLGIVRQQVGRWQPQRVSDPVQLIHVYPVLAVLEPGNRLRRQSGVGGKLRPGEPAALTRRRHPATNQTKEGSDVSR